MASIKWCLKQNANRPVDRRVIDSIKIYCKRFFIKTQDIISNITEKQIEEIRGDLKSF